MAAAGRHRPAVLPLLAAADDAGRRARSHHRHGAEGQRRPAEDDGSGHGPVGRVAAPGRRVRHPRRAEPDAVGALPWPRTPRPNSTSAASVRRSTCRTSSRPTRSTSTASTSRAKAPASDCSTSSRSSCCPARRAPCTGARRWAARSTSSSTGPRRNSRPAACSRWATIRCCMARSCRTCRWARRWRCAARSTTSSTTATCGPARTPSRTTRPGSRRSTTPNDELDVYVWVHGAKKEGDSPNLVRRGYNDGTFRRQSQRVQYQRPLGRSHRPGCADSLAAGLREPWCSVRRSTGTWAT